MIIHHLEGRWDAGSSGPNKKDGRLLTKERVDFDGWNQVTKHQREQYSIGRV